MKLLKKKEILTCLFKIKYKSAYNVMISRKRIVVKKKETLIPLKAMGTTDSPLAAFIARVR